MKEYTIKELMVPKSDYAVISKEATIFDAVAALEKAQKDFDPSRHPHRAILVKDKNDRIVGKLSQLDILRSLQPKYEDVIDESRGIIKYGFSRRLLASMMENLRFFDKPLDNICKKAAQEKVSKYMHRLTEGEYIREDASLDEAIYLLVSGHHQSLLVIRNDEIIGILRLTDVFAAIFDIMKTCEI